MSLQALPDIRSGQVLRWPVPEEFTSSPAVAYRNRFALALSTRSVPEIVESFVYLSPAEMKRLVHVARTSVGAPPFRGVGMELGSGCGLLSATIAREPGVEAMLAVEICEQVAASLIPKVASGVLQNSADKVTPVVGSFDDLQVPDNSIDFIVEIDSFHHSDDLPRTVSECSRVLKPGGRLMCLDRCHSNSVSDADVERMLSEVYSRRFLIQNAYPPDIKLTRRENGEHEYRLFEWQAAFKSAGLRLVRTRKLIKEVPLRKAVKGVLGLFPAPLRRAVYQTDNATIRETFTWMAQPVRNRFATSEFGRPLLAPKATTVFLLEKAH
jgi:ubiquinone/menaquinone biosynthesis C-methylase UbiE